MKSSIRVTAALGAVALAASLSACDRGPRGAASATPEPSEQTVNVPAAAPTGDPPGTTPVTANTSELSRNAESTKMPQEGDDHAYSTVSPSAPQKSGAVDPIQATPERTQQ